MKKLFFFIALILGLQVNLFSQVLGGGNTILSEVAPKWHMGFSADVGWENTLASDLQNGYGGDLAVYSGSANVKFQGIYDMRHFLSVSLNYTYSYFDFSEISPFSSLNKLSALVFYSHTIDEKWSVFAMGNFSLGADASASFWSGKYMSAGVGAAYRITPDLSLGAGGIAYSRLDKSWLGLPIAFVDWKINKKWTLRTFAGATVFYDVFEDQSLMLSATFEYRNSYYRLPDSNGRKYSVADSYFNVNIGATYTFRSRAYISASLGADLGRELSFRENSQKTERIDVSAAPVFALHAGWLF